MQFKQALNKFDFFILTKLMVYNIKKALHVNERLFLHIKFSIKLLNQHYAEQINAQLSWSLSPPKEPEHPPH